ncbi:MAG: hypothetical protein Q9164_005418 [Protoblastenia rupestris]
MANDRGKRLLEEGDAFRRDGTRPNKRRLTDVVRDWPRVKEYQSKAGPGLIPPNWGSELYAWLRQHDVDGDFSPETEDSDEGSVEEDCQTDVSQCINASKGVTRGWAAFDASVCDVEISIVPRPTINESYKPSISRSSESGAEAVFTPPSHSHGCHTDASEDASSKKTEITPNNEDTRTQRLRQETPTGTLSAHAVARAMGKCKKTSVRDKAFRPVSYDASRPRPHGYPEAWAQAHPADKMIICMKEENHSWRAIGQRWQEITGHDDAMETLKWRYRMLKRNLGLKTDEDIERVLMAEAMARFNSHSKGILNANPKNQGALRRGITRARDGSFAKSNYPSSTISVQEPSFPNVDPLPSRKCEVPCKQASETPINMIFEAEPRTQERKAFRKRKSSSPCGDFVLHANREILERGMHCAEEITRVVQCEANEISRLRSSNNAKPMFVTQTKRQLLECAGTDIERELTMVEGGDGGVGGLGCIDKNFIPSGCKATKPTKDATISKDSMKEPGNYEQECQPAFLVKATKWVTIKLPSGQHAGNSSSRGLLHPDSIHVAKPLSRPLSSCWKMAYSDLDTTQPPPSVRSKLHLIPPRAQEPPEESISADTAQSGCSSISVTDARAIANSENSGPTSDTMNLTRLQLQPSSKPVRNSTNKSGDQILADEINALRAKLREKARRRKLSVAMKTAWAKRQAEGRNGNKGGLPRLSTILKTLKKTGRGGVIPSEVRHSAGLKIGRT